MAGETEVFQSCQECGATIYPEHIERHVADQYEGRLLCSHCLQEKRGGAATAVAVGDAGAVGTEPAASGYDEPIVLADEEPAQGEAHPSAEIRAIGGGPGGLAAAAARQRRVELRRPLLTGVASATRCRSFHCKLTDAALGHVNEQINEWADADEHIEIKFATSCIGVVEGKHNDPHLIVTVFY
jgi:hypothetical protein